MPCDAQPESRTSTREASGKARGYGDKLVLVYTMACPLKCDFCCHPVEDYGPVKIRKDEAIDWIRQTADIESFGLVAFTGGEPFLYHRELAEILEATHRPGLQMRIVTAAHWAATPQKALDMLRPLQERGLTELSVSTDPSHQEFVPASFAENASKAALELGLVTEFAGVFWRQGIAIEDVVDVPAGALTTRGLVAPTGRAKRAEIDARSYGFVDDARFGACGDPGYYDLTVYPDGEVYPCCSGGFQIEAGLSFGNLRRERVAEVFGRMRGDRYTRLIIDVGLYPVYQVAKLKFPEVYAKLPPREDVASICELCAVIHADAELMALLEPVLAYVDDVLAAGGELAAQARATPEVGASP